MGGSAEAAQGRVFTRLTPYVFLVEAKAIFGEYSTHVSGITANINQRLSQKQRERQQADEILSSCCRQEEEFLDIGVKIPGPGPGSLWEIYEQQ